MINKALKPTPIMLLNRFSKKPDALSLYMKRDDLTGFELSGNKIRKLEFSLEEALALNASMLLTCGGPQSNHCRATAALGAQMGLPVHLFLRQTDAKPEANLFLDILFGATIHWQEKTASAESLLKSMEDYALLEKSKGETPYVIPMGASNGIGALGYYHAFDEIVAFEKKNGFQFDAIVSAVGSGGTFAGLLLGQMKHKHPAHHIGFSVSGSTEYFKSTIDGIIQEALPLIPTLTNTIIPNYTIYDTYSGPAYGEAVPEVYQLIQQVAREEGILLDPVYTGKAFYGLVDLFKKQALNQYSKILFIHTGGAFGLFAYKDHF